jgi:C-terminal processing protease CtpA/Prc
VPSPAAVQERLGLKLTVEPLATPQTFSSSTISRSLRKITRGRLDAISVPFARAINPISKTNWEGTGVEPDVKVPAADALSTAQKLAAATLAAKP